MFDLAKQIFTFERIGDFGYTQSKKIDFNRYPNLKMISSLQEEEDINEIKNRLSRFFHGLDQLGPYELYLLGKLYPIRNSIIALVGSEGCGKTVTSYFLESFLTNNRKSTIPFQRPFIIRIDCNSIYTSGTNIDNDLNYIFSQISLGIINKIYNNYWAEFEKYIKDNIGEDKVHVSNLIDNYFRSLRENLHGFSIFSKDKIKTITDSIIEREVMPIRKIEFALNLVGALWTNQNEKFIYLCIDNLDPYHILIQSKLLKALLFLVNNSILPVIIPLRMITTKQNDEIRAHVSAKIPHSGVTPLQEINKRSSQAISLFYNKVKLSSRYPYHNVSALNKFSFIIRTAELYEQFNSNKEFKEIFRAISGFSIRRGLAFIVRAYADSYSIPIIHNFSKYFNEIDASEYLKKWSNFSDFDNLMNIVLEDLDILYGKTSKSRPKAYHFNQFIIELCFQAIDDSNSIIENIFFDEYINEIQSTKYCILKELYEKTQSSSHDRTISIGLVIDSLIELGYFNESIYKCINSLLEPERSLIWSSGKNAYDDFNDLYQDRTQVLGLTNSGEHYYLDLSHSLDYIGFMLSRNDTDKSRIKNNNLTIRMTHLMRLIYDILKQEFDDFIYTEGTKIIVEHSSYRIKKNDLLFAKLFSETLTLTIDVLSRHHDNLKKTLQDYNMQLDNIQANEDKEYKTSLYSDELNRKIKDIQIRLNEFYEETYVVFIEHQNYLKAIHDSPRRIDQIPLGILKLDYKGIIS